MTASSPPDLYAILGVEPSADTEQIRQAYRRLVLEWHPDRNPRDQAAADRFQAASDAYKVLKDEESRREYDLSRARATGRAWVDSLAGRRRPERGSDLKYRLELSIEAIHRGGEHVLHLERARVCDVCGGSGGRPGTRPVQCSTCDGRGSRGGWLSRASCRDCGGAGQRYESACPVCAGRGRTRVKTRVTVDVPRGVASATRLRLRGHGDEGRDGGGSGDLYVTVHQRPHDFFRRDGANLELDLPISLADAVLGAEADVPTLEGQSRLRIEPGTESGHTIVWKGQGLHRSGGSTGDLQIRIVVEMPTALTSPQREVFQRLRELESSGAPTSRVARFRQALSRRGGS